MAARVFLDANILLDLILHRQGFPLANNIMQAGINGSLQLYTTPSVLHIVAYFSKKHFKVEKTKQILSTLLNDVQIIDSDHSTAIAAINSSIDDIEDALQYYTALNHNADYFISSDKKLKNSSLPQLPVFTAKGFVEEHDKNLI